jgi:uncharacterized membrane protein
MVLEGKTKTGELDFKMAAAACYMPMMFIHLLAAVVFLAAEPKEHRFVRFHAVQSLLLAAFFIGGSLVALIGGMVVIPLVVMLIGGVAGGALSAVSEDLGALVVTICGLLSFVSYLVGALLSLGLSLAFMPAFLINLVMVVTGKVGRWPVFGGLAERFV